jgi:multicomponent Na+:H+ antiporter subunit E
MALKRTHLSACAARFAGFGALWWVLVEGRLDAPFIAALVVGAATGASLVLKPPARVRWKPLAIIPLAGYFLLQSLQGGIDIARRALAPSLPIRPALLTVELRLPGGFPIVLYAWLVSLTPGSASVQVTGRTLIVHVLDERLPVENGLRELERRVGRIFAGSVRKARRA